MRSLKSMVLVAVLYNVLSEKSREFSDSARFEPSFQVVWLIIVEIKLTPVMFTSMFFVCLLSLFLYQIDK